MSSITSATNKIAQTIAGYLGTADDRIIGELETSFGEHIAAAEETPITPYELFWGLLKEWWKQLIDGKFHKFTAMVFDKGLHKGPVEPGFIASAEKACLFLSEALLKNKAPITVPLYKKTHAIACAHFAKEKTETLMHADRAGEFHVGQECFGTLGDLFIDPDLDKRLVKAQYICIDYSEFRSSGWFQQESLLKEKGMTREAFIKQAEEAENFWDEAQAKVRAKAAELNKYIEEQSKLLGKTGPIASVTINSGALDVQYRCYDQEAEVLVKKLFEDFEKNIAKAETEDQKIRCIAYLYQMLEWIHPFYDGQGRTDLMLLSALLCKHGLNPAILEDPYVSTYCSFEDWVSYLKKGMAKWREEYSRIHSE